jgi:hypothetical protein
MQRLLNAVYFLLAEAHAAGAPAVQKVATDHRSRLQSLEDEIKRYDDLPTLDDEVALSLEQAPTPIFDEQFEAVKAAFAAVPLPEPAK